MGLMDRLALSLLYALPPETAHHAALYALEHHLVGIQDADSITCDAHKWLSAPLGAGMFLSRDREPRRRTACHAK